MTERPCFCVAERARIAKNKIFCFLERSKSQPDELAPKSPDYLTVPDAGQHRHSRSKSFPLEAFASTASMRSVVIHSSPRDGGSTREEHRTDIPPRIEMYVFYRLSTNKMSTVVENLGLDKRLCSWTGTLLVHTNYFANCFWFYVFSPLKHDRFSGSNASTITTTKRDPRNLYTVFDVPGTDASSVASTRRRNQTHPPNKNSKRLSSSFATPKVHHMKKWSTSFTKLTSFQKENDQRDFCTRKRFETFSRGQNQK